MYDAIRSGSKIIGEEKNDITADVARQAVLNLYKGGQILTTPQVVVAQLREWNLEPATAAELDRTGIKLKGGVGKFGGKLIWMLYHR